VAINNCEVYLNSIEQDVINEINQKNSNSKYFPNLKLHKNIKAGIDFQDDVDFVFIGVPSNVARNIFEKISITNYKKTCGFVICSKGFEDKTLSLLSDSFERITKNKNYVVVSGPNFHLNCFKK